MWKKQKTPLVFFSLFLFDLVMMRVLNQFLPLTLSQLTPTQEGKQTSQESVSTTTSESQRSNQHRWEMFIAMEGPKLDDNESSAWAEFCRGAWAELALPLFSEIVKNCCLCV